MSFSSWSRLFLCRFSNFKCGNCLRRTPIRITETEPFSIYLEFISPARDNRTGWRIFAALGSRNKELYSSGQRKGWNARKVCRAFSFSVFSYAPLTISIRLMPETFLLRASNPLICLPSFLSLLKRLQPGYPAMGLNSNCMQSVSIPIFLW